MIILALLLFFLLLIALSDIINELKPIHLSGALVLAIPAFICLESIILNVLSLFQGVNQHILIFLHVALLFGWLGYIFLLKRKKNVPMLGRYRMFFSHLFKPSPYQLLIPLIILLALSAWIYPPNTYDSLTYHMSRVARWIQESSIAYFPTPIDRQNVMGPGAEYVILFFQLITGSDYLASFLQFFSFLLLIVGVSYLCRILLIPNSLTPYLTILTITAPMAIMQASGTKNDLTAALLTIAIIISCRRVFGGHIKNMGSGEYLTIGIALSAAYLVKPTAVIVCLPLLIGSAVYQLVRLRSLSAMKSIILGATVIMVVFAAVAGPDIARKAAHNVSRHEVYPLLSDYDADRFWNPLRGVAQNVPFPEQTKSVLKKIGYDGELRTNNVLNFAEDMVGNPFQVLSFLILTIVSLVLAPLLIFNRHWGPAFLAWSPVFAWFVFGIVVRDQAWLTRLQIPLFVLLPFSFVYFFRVIANKSWLFNKVAVFLAISSFISLSYGTLVASHVPSRPLSLSHFWGERVSRINAYYNNIGLEKNHTLLLNQAKIEQCSRIGLILGPDSVEYPITWRAMQQGIETRHMWSSFQEREERYYRTFHFIEQDKNWPCLIYVAHGSREAVPNQGIQWIPVDGDYNTHTRNLKWDFDRSETICFSADGEALKSIANNFLNSEVSVQGKSLILDALTGDPSFEIDNTACGKTVSVIARLEIVSEVETDLKVYFKLSSMAHFSESHFKSTKISKGGNVRFLFLPMSDIDTILRIDPGESKGRYSIVKIDIRGIENSSDKGVKQNRTFRTRLE